MKLTIEKLTQIIREEVENVTNEAWKPGDDPALRPGRANVGPSRREKWADRADPAYKPRDKRVTQLTKDEKDIISDEIDNFLAKANDENSGWWPQTWVGGGRVWTGSDYVDRTPEQNKAIRDQFDKYRASSGRDPFTADHIKQDIKQTGSSVWLADPKTKELKHPSLSAFIKQYLTPSISTELGIMPMDAENKLKAYLSDI